MTLGAIGIGDTQAFLGPPTPATCIVGALDANGNTISSCGYTPGMDLTTGQMIANAPTCMAGDTLSFVNGSWVCVPQASSPGFPQWAILALIAVGFIALAGKR